MNSRRRPPVDSPAKKRDENARVQGETEMRRLNASLQQQRSALAKAKRLAEELHETLKEAEAHVADGRRKVHKRSGE